MCWRVKPRTAHFEKLNTEHVCGCQTQQVILEQMKESECLRDEQGAQKERPGYYL